MKQHTGRWAGLLLAFALLASFGGAAVVSNASLALVAESYEETSAETSWWDTALSYITDTYGCTDSSATNYNATANYDDGTCQYSWNSWTYTYGCTNSTASNYDSNAMYDDGSCQYFLAYSYGCTDPSATNYDQYAYYDDGTCAHSVAADAYGCTDSTATNYNPAASMNDWSCQYSYSWWDTAWSYITDTYGCTDPSANNYNSTANYNDGSCQYMVYGCTDMAATNYNLSAYYDDGSCQYQEECQSTIVDLSGAVSVDESSLGGFDQAYNDATGESIDSTTRDDAKSAAASAINSSLSQDARVELTVCRTSGQWEFRSITPVTN